jgi:protein SMG9
MLFVEDIIFCENEKVLIEKLRTKIHGISRNPMTPSVLTERSW